MKRRQIFNNVTFVVVMAASMLAWVNAAASDKPNILVIWGDDVGQSNISAYTMGLMGYQTPNIDRVAKEGMIFTDYYAEQRHSQRPDGKRVTHGGIPIHSRNNNLRPQPAFLHRPKR